MFAGSAGTVGDARSKIGGGKISDARFGGATKFKMQPAFFRDVLAAKGKGLDARQKLEKMRNLKVRNVQTCHLPGSDVMLPAVSSNVKSYKLFMVGWQPGGEEGWWNHRDKEGEEIANQS